jgi:membrane protein implicated in regulation of membrane protease activity
MDAVSAFYFSHPFWVWLALGAVFLSVEVVTGSGWLLWPAGSAALVGVISLAAPRLGGPGALVLFAALTVVSTFVGRRWLRGVPHGGPNINDPLARLISHRGEVSHAFDGGLGRVFVDGKEWSAELDDAGALAAGAKVEVIAVLGGARLKVRAL